MLWAFVPAAMFESACVAAKHAQGRMNHVMLISDHTHPKSLLLETLLDAPLECDAKERGNAVGIHNRLPK
jgi:hypothetical protein